MLTVFVNHLIVNPSEEMQTGKVSALRTEAHFTFVIRSNKSQDVLMSQHNGLIYFRFPEPGTLLT